MYCKKTLGHIPVIHNSHVVQKALPLTPLQVLHGYPRSPHRACRHHHGLLLSLRYPPLGRVRAYPGDPALAVEVCQEQQEQHFLCNIRHGSGTSCYHLQIYIYNVLTFIILSYLVYSFFKYTSSFLLKPQFML